MWTLEDSNGREIAEAADADAIKLAARTLFEEGERLPFKLLRNGQFVATAEEVSEFDGTLAYHYTGSSLDLAIPKS